MALNGDSHAIAVWGGVAAFFGSLLAVGIFDVLDLAQWTEYVGALLVAGITAGSVYSKQRLDDAKEAKDAQVKLEKVKRR